MATTPTTPEDTLNALLLRRGLNWRFDATAAVNAFVHDGREFSTCEDLFRAYCLHDGHGDDATDMGMEERLQILAETVLAHASEDVALRSLAVVYFALQGCTGTFFVRDLSLGMANAFVDSEITRLHLLYMTTGDAAAFADLWNFVCARGSTFGEDRSPVELTPLATPQEQEKMVNREFRRGADFLDMVRAQPNWLG